VAALGSPRTASLRSELLSFPTGKHDDQVDTLGLIGQLLDTIAHWQQAGPVQDHQTRQSLSRVDFGEWRMNGWVAY
jgi:hypothetical protein